MSFNIGLSGLYAANKQLDVTGNNIANVATTGFKSSRAEFADVYSATKLGSGSKTIGNGVRLANVSQQFGQGDVNNTGNVLDMGIQGQGFFVLSDNGSLTYTRAGTFKTDKEGYITNSDGTMRLQGYGVDADGKIINGTLTNLRIDTSNLQPKPTGLVDSTLNFNSNADKITVEFDPTKVETYTKKFTTPIYDTQGNEHQMDQYMVKTDDNTWKVYTLVDGRDQDGALVTNAAGGNPAVATTIKFDTSGKLASIDPPAGSVAGDPIFVNGNSITMTGWKSGTIDSAGVWTSNGAAFKTGGLSLDMSKITQFNADTARSTLSQDGYSTGQITNLTIDGTGTLFANFSNQQSKAIGQIALASFTNEQGLQPVGGTGWKETFSSGTAGFDTPKTGTLGSVVSNSLEESNVNLTSELVDLIKAQSNYQANAKTISTQSTIMQTIIQMT